MNELDLEALLEAPLRKPKEQDSKNDEKGSVKRSNDEVQQEEDRKKHRKSPSKDTERNRSDKRRSSRERESERDRDRDRRRGSDSRRERSSRRSRSRERRRSRSRDRKRSDSREGERDKERQKLDARKKRDIERQREREREALLDPKEREAIELDRDQRTVFVLNIPLKVDEEDLLEFFTKAGKVRDIRLITDRVTGRSKGFGYIEFFDKASVPAGLALNGRQLKGQPIQVNPTQAEKNKTMQPTTTVTTFLPTRLYVGSLHFNVTEEDIKETFKRFGEIDYINLHVDNETGRTKGYAFVQFRRPEDTKRALSQSSGLEILGRPVKVGLVNDTGGNTPTGQIGKHGDLDDDEGGGVKMNAQSRVALMAKLQRGAAVSTNGSSGNVSPPQSKPQTTSPPHTNSYSTTNSPCILLTNMFDPLQETEPNWDIEIGEDVKEECSKFGNIVHVSVDKNSSGHVWMKFANSSGAQNAVNSLNHRWFAQRMITAEIIPESYYYARFPESVNK